MARHPIQLPAGVTFDASRDAPALFVRCVQCDHPAWAHGIGACAICDCPEMSGVTVAAARAGRPLRSARQVRAAERARRIARRQRSIRRRPWWRQKGK